MRISLDWMLTLIGLAFVALEKGLSFQASRAALREATWRQRAFERLNRAEAALREARLELARVRAALPLNRSARQGKRAR